MSGWMPADSGAARKVTEKVIERVARQGAWTPSDTEEIADAWLEFGSARYDDGRGDEREGY